MLPPAVFARVSFYSLSITPVAYHLWILSAECVTITYKIGSIRNGSRPRTRVCHPLKVNIKDVESRSCADM